MQRAGDPWGWCRRAKALLVVFLVITVSSCLCPESAGQSFVGPKVSKRFERVDELLLSAIEDHRAAGAALLVSKDGELCYLRSHGELVLGQGEPLRHDSIFRIHSMTKAMTSTVALMLWEEGRLRLDEPVASYLPEWGTPTVAENMDAGLHLRPSARMMTVRHLLRHTSGIPYSNAAPSFYGDLYDEVMGAGTSSLAEYSERLSRLPLLHDPDARWTYGASTDVLARVVEVAAAIPFEELLRERLIEPLGMVDTGYWVSGEDWHRFVAAHRVDEAGAVEGVIEAAWERYRAPPTHPMGGHGLVSTLPDYHSFLQMLLSGGQFEGRRYLRESTVALMCSPLSAGGGPHPEFNSFGLGFEIANEDDELDGWAMSGAYGWSGAARTYYLVDPNNHLVILLFSQTRPFEITLRQDVFRAVHAALGLTSSPLEVAGADLEVVEE